MSHHDDERIHENPQYKEDRDAILKDPTVLGAHRDEDDTAGIAPAKKREAADQRTAKVNAAIGEEENMEIGDAELNTGTEFDSTIGDPTILGPKGD